MKLCVILYSALFIILVIGMFAGLAVLEAIAWLAIISGVLMLGFTGIAQCIYLLFNGDKIIMP